ncbi:MAG: hypothetical protein R3B13_22035 [Polyangiaceae bacterium]
MLGPTLVRVRLSSGIGSGPDRQLVTLWVEDASGAHVYDFAREVDFSHHSTCGMQCRHATVELETKLPEGGS